MRARRAFTLIELMAVVLILGILVAVALPRYFDYSGDARDSADEGALAGIRTALTLAYVEHRRSDAPSTEWVLTVNDIAAVLETGRLPEGIAIAGSDLVDQRGNTYTFTPETAADPARLAP